MNPKSDIYHLCRSCRKKAQSLGTLQEIYNFIYSNTCQSCDRKGGKYPLCALSTHEELFTHKARNITRT